MTTKLLAEIERMNKAGMNDSWIADQLGIDQTCASYWRNKLGLPVVGKNRGAKIYTVYDGKTSQFICEGRADECAKWLGIKVKYFYYIAWMFEKGKYKKYEIYEVEE